MTSAEAIEALPDVIGEGVSCETMSRSVRVRPDRYADSTVPALRPTPAGRRRRCLRSRARRPGRVRYQDQHRTASPASQTWLWNGTRRIIGP